jgi:hypothetical protein
VPATWRAVARALKSTTVHAASAKSFTEIQIHKAHSKQSGSSRLGLRNLFLYTFQILKFENHCSRKVNFKLRILESWKKTKQQKPSVPGSTQID